MTNILLDQAITALRIDDRPAAREILGQLQKQQPEQVATWLWSAAASENAAEKRKFLEHVLVIDPQHQRAQAALRVLGVPVDHPVQIAPDEPPAVQEPISSDNALSVPHFAPTGVTTRRMMPWMVIALIIALIVLIPLTLWLI